MKQDYRTAKTSFDVMTDAEVEQMVDNFIAFKEKEYNLFVKYNSEFKKVLPIRKVAKLYRAEQEFVRKVLEKINQRRQQNQGQRPGMNRPRGGGGQMRR